MKIALHERKMKKNKNCIDLNILINVFEFASFDIWEQQAEAQEVKYYIEVPKLINNKEVVIEEKDIIVFMTNVDNWFFEQIYGDAKQKECKFVQDRFKKKRRQKPCSNEKCRVKMKVKSRMKTIFKGFKIWSKRKKKNHT